MEISERLAAVEAIRQLKARYWRGVDDGDAALVRSVLARECRLDYRGCCTDPVTGIDHMPAMNIVLKGRESWPDSPSPVGPRIVTVHQGNDPDIVVDNPRHASAIWSFTDRFFLPAGGPFERLTGWGRYHDTYVHEDGSWKLATTRITRLRIEVS